MNCELRTNSILVLGLCVTSFCLGALGAVVTKHLAKKAVARLEEFHD